MGTLNKVVTKVFPEGSDVYQRAERDEVSNHAAIGKGIPNRRKSQCKRPCTEAGTFKEQFGVSVVRTK